MNSKPQTASSAPVAGEPAPGWVRFEEEGGRAPSNMESPSTQAPDGQEEYNGAVIKPETVHVNLNRSMSHSVSLEQSSTPPSTVFRGVPGDSPEVTTSTTSGKQPAMRSVNLNDVVNGRSTNTGRVSTHGGAVVRQGFANGDIIVTLLPVNTKFPWVTPAQFRPELVPEELMAQGLTLTVEDYVHVMEVLTNDVRFNVYNVCYKRILVAWIFTAFVVLLGLLFSGVTGLTLFGLGVMWLVLNAAAIFLCMWVKIKLNQNLERCMAQVNKHLLRHSIILGLDDRGKLSCHKVNLCFIYFDTMDCIKKLQEVIDREEREGRPVNREETAEERRQRQAFQERMDIEDRDIIIQGSNTTRLSRKQVSSVPSLWTETSETSSYRGPTPPDCLGNRDIIQGSTTTRLSRKQVSSAPSLWTETSSYRGPTPPDCLGNKDIIIQGTNTTRLSRKQGWACQGALLMCYSDLDLGPCSGVCGGYWVHGQGWCSPRVNSGGNVMYSHCKQQVKGEQLFARYIQRWAKDYLRRRLDWTVDEEGGNPMEPRHLAPALCPCQYIEEYLRNKPRSDKRAFCPCWTAFLTERGIN
ncbi:unnamed protein product [Timema podura]|uniref:Transmembrane protein 268 n=1 Tax=Timema podura TaxID=61482 RepID=A0ABN7NJT3_TIMPD|nr:unnamed protein product [Timema podura]